MNNQSAIQPQKFTSDVIWVGVCQLFTLLTGLVTLAALTKCYSPETYGVWVQALVTVGLMSPLLTLHLGGAIVRFLAAEDDIEKRRRAFGTMLWPILAFTCLLLIISLLLRQNLATFLFSEPKYSYLVLLIFLWVSI